MKYCITILLLLVVNFCFSQSLSNLSFGTNNNLDIITWNLENFPKNGQTTIDSVAKIIEYMDAEVIAIQEIANLSSFNTLISQLSNYNGYCTTGTSHKLAFIYKSNLLVDTIYSIYNNSVYNFGQRAPLVISFNLDNELYNIINSHFKCCGNGILDTSNIYDEENRRYNAMNMIKQYIDIHMDSAQVIFLGDLNDLLTDPYSNNVFRNILNDTLNYFFVDLPIANGSSYYWSYPPWPSHIDHILITNELIQDLNCLTSFIETIRLDDYFNGGFSIYDLIVSDHRPLGLSLQRTIAGCTDSLALNYDSTAILSDSCVFSVFGCTNSSANNYNPSAMIDDSSCIYTPSTIANLYFSEYAEGSSNNKYFEVYNASNDTVDLTTYAFPSVGNAPTTVGVYENSNDIDP